MDSLEPIASLHKRPANRKAQDADRNVCDIEHVAEPPVKNVATKRGDPGGSIPGPAFLRACATGAFGFSKAPASRDAGCGDSPRSDRARPPDPRERADSCGWPIRSGGR